MSQGNIHAPSLCSSRALSWCRGLEHLRPSSLDLLRGRFSGFVNPRAHPCFLRAWSLPENRLLGPLQHQRRNFLDPKFRANLFL